jgi:cytochrome c556
MRLARPVSAFLVLTAFAGIAAAQEAATPSPVAPAEAHEIRETHMKGYAQQLQVLGPMAQGQTAYDATAAQAAADAILANATSPDWETMWPEGSAQGEVPESEALPAIWQNAEDFQAKHQALIDAATTLQADAGKDLASLQAALGGVGQACGACHQAYRVPSQ